MDTIDVPDLYEVYSVLYGDGNGPLWASIQILRIPLVVTRLGTSFGLFRTFFETASLPPSVQNLVQNSSFLCSGSPIGFRLVPGGNSPPLNIISTFPIMEGVYDLDTG